MDIENTRAEAWKLFDRIAKRYDFLNRLLSMRQDVAWRKKLVKMLPQHPDLQVLDVATGTGDQAIFIAQQIPHLKKATGLDLSENMLAVANKKINDQCLTQKVNFLRGDGASLPFDDNSFDAVTISFGIRNIPRFQKAIQEMHRVLKPGGKVLILEFSLPEAQWIKGPYLFYFRKVLPQVGGAISGDRSAYKYLNSTVEEFPYGEEFAQHMRGAGFKNVTLTPLSFGIATIYSGLKDSPPLSS